MPQIKESANTLSIGIVMLLASLLLASAHSEEEYVMDVSTEWRSFIDPIASIAERIAPLLPNPEDPQQRHELYRHLFSLMSTAYWNLVYQDPDNPDFIFLFYEYMTPEPGTTYSLTPIRGNGVYKISGTRGSSLLVTFTIGTGQFFTRGVGENESPSLADYDLDSIQIDKDGSYEVILSETRPEDHTGNWWYLDPKATSVFARQRTYDWENEETGSLAIQRLDRPIRRPLQSAEELAGNMRQVAVWVEAWAKSNMGYANRIRSRGLVNQVVVEGLNEYGGYQLQKYVQGLWDLNSDEALIYETEVPEECRYWDFHLADEMFNTTEKMNRNHQTALNGRNARIDSDGKFRAVISAQDPGIHNWLDTEGYKKGIIWGRWQQCSSYPTPTMKKVNVADIWQHLPKDTPAISLEQREISLRLRRETSQLRRRWN